MSEQLTTFMEEILANLETANYIRPQEIPNIELYMDQVTTFMDEHLSSSKRNCDDKILTKTMINNYAKNDLLPPPIKKKYSREHMLMMIFIYYFKGFLSISDIQSLLNPLAKEHFSKDSELSLQEVYERLFGLEKEQLQLLKEDVERKFEVAKNSFTEAEDKEFLQIFTMVGMLSFDVYMKKQMIEKIIDTLLPKTSEEEEKAAKKAEAKAMKKAEAKSSKKAAEPA